MLQQHNFEFSKPTSTEKKLAKNSIELINKVDVKRQKSAKLIIDDKLIELPIPAVKLLLEALQQLSEGNALTLIPRHANLTTQEAADLLNVSRPFLVKLLESGDIPFTRVGNRRKVLADDIFSYKNANDKKRQKSLDLLVEQAQDLDLGY